MATAAQAIERISEATGILHATVFRLARHLRDAEGKDLWPLGITGAPKRGHEVIVYQRHIINLLLGLSVSPITSAADLVAWMRELVPHPHGTWDSFLPGATLAQALENLIDDAARLRAKPVTIKISRFGDRMPTVILRSGAVGVTREMFFVPGQVDLEIAFPAIPEAAPFVTFKIRQPLIDVAAELWADTKSFITSRKAAARPQEVIL